MAIYDPIDEIHSLYDEYGYDEGKIIEVLEWYKDHPENLNALMLITGATGYNEDDLWDLIYCFTQRQEWFAQLTKDEKALLHQYFPKYISDTEGVTIQFESERTMVRFQFSHHLFATIEITCDLDGELSHRSMPMYWH